MAADKQWMLMALKAAEKGRGQASPNPIVGACLVKGNRLISHGYHRAYGAPHAEVEALRAAGRRARGATLYVTLEPCSTYGKTPPCTEAILEAGISRVVIGALDPNPKHHRRGVAILKKHGIRVKTGVLREEAELQNEAFAKWARTGLPFVTLKMAQSLDGKIALPTGAGHWISSASARQWVHRLRRMHDAVLVGKNTVLQDDPRLTVRPRLLEPKGSEKNGRVAREPWRIVLDERGAVSPKARVFKGRGSSILVCSEFFVRSVLKKFRNTRVTIFPLGSKNGRLDLQALLRRLGSLGITSLLVEGGGEVAWSFFEGGFVDKIAWILAPKIIGGRDSKTSVEGAGVRSLTRALKVERTQMRRLGDDILLEGYVKK